MQRSSFPALRRSALVFAALTALVASPRTQVQVHDSTAQFPTSAPGANPTNNWFYGYFIRNSSHSSSDIHPATWMPQTPPLASSFQQPGWSVPSAGWAFMHKPTWGPILQGAGNLNGRGVTMVRGWRAPANGTVVVTSTDRVGFHQPAVMGDGVTPQIWRNDLLLWQNRVTPATTGGPGGNGVTIPSVTCPVNTNDWLWFQFDEGKDTAGDGGLVYNPIVTFTPGPGYNAATTWSNSVAAFTTSAAQGNAAHQGWSYGAWSRTASNPTFVPMSAGSDHLGPYWGMPGEYCRVYTRMAHPSPVNDAVRRWTAPTDGVVLLSGTPGQPMLEKAWGGGDPVQVLVYHTTANGRKLLYDEIVSVGSPAHLGVIVHMRANERLDVHTRYAPAAAPVYGWYVNFNLDVQHLPAGEPPPVVTDLPATTITSPTWWFNRHVRISGDLNVYGSLTADHCVIELQNTYERQYRYAWNWGGVLRTRNSHIGGCMTANGTIWHSNLEMDGGLWIVRDTTLQYTFGQLLANGAVLFGTGLKGGVGADAIILPGGTGGPTSIVFLDNSRQYFAWSVPATNNAPIALSLPIGTPLGTWSAPWLAGNFGSGTNHVPGANWVLGLVNTTPYHQHALEVFGIGPYTAKNITVSNCPTLQPALHCDGGIVSTQQLPIGDPVAPSFHALGLQWNLPTPTRIAGWAAYFHDALGACDVTLTGPTAVHELMVFDDQPAAAGPVVRLQGNPGQFDVASHCTTLHAHGPQGRLILSETQLGSAALRGEIKSQNGAIVDIRHARLAPGAQPLDLRCLNGGKVRMYDFPEGRDPSRVTRNGAANAFEWYRGAFLDTWDFTGGLDGWQNWQTGAPPAYEHGFVSTGTSWTAQLVSPPDPLAPANRALHLVYPALPVPSPGTFHPRIVAPNSGAPGHYFDYTSNGTPRPNLYLVARVKCNLANPRQVAGTGVVNAYFSGRVNGSWTSHWNAIFREMQLRADSTWHTYVWNLNNPAAAGFNPFHSYDVWNWTPLPAGLDVWSLTFASFSGMDNPHITAGDSIDVDFVTITDDPRGWN